VEAAQYFPALAEAARRLPGVEAAAVANCLPLQDGCDRVVMRGAGVGVGDDSPRSVALNMVEPDYFRVLGIAVLRGRGFAPGDREGTARVALVSQSVAQRDFGGADPIGQRIVLSMDEAPAEIVGIVADVAAAPGEAVAPPLVYLPFAQVRYEDNFVVLRSAGDPHPAIAPLRAAARQLSGGVALWDIASMGERLDGLVARLRLATALLGGLGVLALLLAGAGVFSVLNLLVVQRTAEFGLRLAVGATPRHVLALVLRDAAGVLGAGLGLAALAAAALLPRYAGDALFRAAALDARVFAAAALLLTLCVLAASLLPARRALAVDPLVALHQD
jgi:putative ABC transport system permease protein